MKFISILMLMIVFLANVSMSQTVAKVLKPGDRVPDVLLNNMINYPNGKAKISDFRGKLLILDFFNKGCGTCIASFPQMEKLQSEFGDRIQILLVTQDAPESIRQLIKTSPIAKTINLPFVTGNNQLYSQLFKHTTDPYHVWIGEDDIVKAVTSFYNTDSVSIASYLGNKSISLAMRNDCPDWDDEVYKSLLQEGNGRQYQYLHSSSVIMNYIPCIRISTSGLATDSTTGRAIGLKMINISLLGLFQFAYVGGAYGGFPYPADRIILDVSNPKIYIQPINANEIDAWKSKNLFCYELRVPSAISWTCSADSAYAKFRKMMRSDLERYFFIATEEQRDLPCLVLIRTTKDNKLKTLGETTTMEKTKFGYVIRNLSVSDFIYDIGLANRESNIPPLVDESNYSGNIDLNLNCSLDDIPKLRIELSKYGLDLIVANRKINVLVLRDQ